MIVKPSRTSPLAVSPSHHVYGQNLTTGAYALARGPTHRRVLVNADHTQVSLRETQEQPAVVHLRLRAETPKYVAAITSRAQEIVQRHLETIGSL